MAMAHRLQALGRDFELHHSNRRLSDAGLLAQLDAAAWRELVRLSFTENGNRADLVRVIPRYQPGYHLYTCGSARYTDTVLAECIAKGRPEGALPKENFSVPEAPDYANHPYVLKLARSGRSFDVPVDKRATDVLLEAGVAIDMTIFDGICSVCTVPIVSGEVVHRDYVLLKREREAKIMHFYSPAKAVGGEVKVDL